MKMIEKTDLVNVKYEIYTENKKIEEKDAETIVGFSFIYPFIERRMLGLKIGEYEIKVPPEEAFGRKDPSLIQIIPMRFFKMNGIKPKPGMFIEVDGSLGRIISISGGRVIVDFNHPLAGREIVLKIKINRIEKNPEEKIKFLSRVVFGKEIKFEFKDGKVKINDVVPSETMEMFFEYIKRLGYEVERNG